MRKIQMRGVSSIDSIRSRFAALYSLSDGVVRPGRNAGSEMPPFA
jgi:hypothetical protein